ncbi:MAG: hypothetical protein U1E40_05220 [Amaricoccus sp.]
MSPEEDGPAETAIEYADQYLEAGVAKLDALFGAGYAKANPQALAAYVAACASNLNAFMTAAASAMADDDFDMDEALVALAGHLDPPPPARPKGRRR